MINLKITEPKHFKYIIVKTRVQIGNLNTMDYKFKNKFSFVGLALILPLLLASIFMGTKSALLGIASGT